MFSFFLPCAWALKRKGGCSQTKRVLSMGDRKNFFPLSFSEWASDQE